jgi:hypothetical protein
MKKAYSPPLVLSHQPIQFETGISSCLPPNRPGLDLSDNQPICLQPDGTYTK